MLSEIMKDHLKVDIEKMRVKNFLQVQRDDEARSINIIMQQHGLKEISACPLCGSKNHTMEMKRPGSPLFRCDNCQLRFHEKIPVDLNDVYQDPEYIIYPMDDASDEHFKYRIERFGKERVRLLEQHCGSLKNKKILDVGCGNGYCLVAFKQAGAICVGSELSEKWSKLVSEKTRLPVYTAPLENFPEKDFDIITMFDLIEHVEHPVLFVNAAKKLLKPNGHILMYTPNFDSFSSKVLGEYSNHISYNAHLELFCHASLEYLGKATGLKIIHTETRGLDIHSILAYQYFLGEKQDPFLIQWGEELQAMINAADCGDYLRVIYEKI